MIVKCSFCRHDVYKRPCEVKINNFCNYECYAQWQSIHKKGKKLHLTDEERGRRSLSKMGDKNPMFGKIVSLNTRKLQSINTHKRQLKTKSKATLRVAADRLWSKIVRFDNKCEVCGKQGIMNPHHIVGRRNLTLRWDVMNGVCLCSGCHVWGIKSAHQDPVWFHDWIVENKPGVLEYLRARKNIVTNRDISDYESLIESLRDIYYKKEEDISALKGLNENN